MKLPSAVLIILLATVTTFTAAHATIVDVQVSGVDEWDVSHFGAKSQVGSLRIIQDPLHHGSVPNIVITVKQLQSFGGTVHVSNPMTAAGGATSFANGIGPDLPGSIPAVGSVSIPWSSVCQQNGECLGHDNPLILWVDNNPTLSGGTRFMVMPNQDDQIPVTAQPN